MQNGSLSVFLSFKFIITANLSFLFKFRFAAANLRWVQSYKIGGNNSAAHLIKSVAAHKYFPATAKVAAKNSQGRYSPQAASIMTPVPVKVNSFAIAGIKTVSPLWNSRLFPRSSTTVRFPSIQVNDEKVSIVG